MQQKKFSTSPEEYKKHAKQSFAYACSVIPDSVDEISFIKLVLENCSSLMTCDDLRCFSIKLMNFTRLMQIKNVNTPLDDKSISRVHDAMLLIVKHSEYENTYRESELSPSVLNYNLRINPNPFYFAASFGWMDIFMHFYLHAETPDEARSIAFLTLHKYGYNDLINQFAFDQFKLFAETRFALFIAIALIINCVARM